MLVEDHRNTETGTRREGRGARTDDHVDTATRAFRVRMGGAATLWALQSLAARASTPTCNFVGFTIAAFLRASGWAGAAYTSQASGTALEQEWQLK